MTGGPTDAAMTDGPTDAAMTDGPTDAAMTDGPTDAAMTDESKTKKDNAAEAETAAETAKTAYLNAKTAAETAAETAKTAYLTAKTAAETAKTAAETAKTAYLTAETAAETAKTAYLNAGTATKNGVLKKVYLSAKTAYLNAKTAYSEKARMEVRQAYSSKAYVEAKTNAKNAYSNVENAYLKAKTETEKVYSKAEEVNSAAETAKTAYLNAETAAETAKTAYLNAKTKEVEAKTKKTAMDTAKETALTAVQRVIQQIVWDFFRKMDFTALQVAGIMGNIEAETSWNPLVHNRRNAPFWGLFQIDKSTPSKQVVRKSIVSRIDDAYEKHDLGAFISAKRDYQDDYRLLEIPLDKLKMIVKLQLDVISTEEPTGLDWIESLKNVLAGNNEEEIAMKAAEVFMVDFEGPTGTVGKSDDKLEYKLRYFDKAKQRREKARIIYDKFTSATPAPQQAEKVQTSEKSDPQKLVWDNLLGTAFSYRKRDKMEQTNFNAIQVAGIMGNLQEDNKLDQANSSDEVKNMYKNKPQNRDWTSELKKAKSVEEAAEVFLVRYVGKKTGEKNGDNELQYYLRFYQHAEKRRNVAKGYINFDQQAQKK
jgi:hypothetical protein